MRTTKMKTKATVEKKMTMMVPTKATRSEARRVKNEPARFKVAEALFCQRLESPVESPAD
ncbi:MAG TPA: hypothetical protein VFP40_15750 [Terriglobales bacterium]|nr:hypothetical protein [Terriglobales bacterium]